MDQQYKQNGTRVRRFDWGARQPKSRRSTTRTICSTHLMTTHGTERFQIQLPQKLALLQGRFSKVHNNNNNNNQLLQIILQNKYQLH
jgi:hypothetical protein